MNLKSKEEEETYLSLGTFETIGHRPFSFFHISFWERASFFSHHQQKTSSAPQTHSAGSSTSRRREPKEKILDFVIRSQEVYVFVFVQSSTISFGRGTQKRRNEISKKNRVEKYRSIYHHQQQLLRSSSFESRWPWTISFPIQTAFSGKISSNRHSRKQWK